MARPRKYATPAEAADARRQKDAERKRERRAPDHAKKADPSKRKDAFVNAKNWPAAPIDEETLRIVGEIVAAIGSDDRNLKRMRLAAQIMESWEEANRARLSWIHPEDGKSGCPKLTSDQRAVIERWNEFVGVLQWCRDVLLPRQRRSIQRAAKEQAEAAALNITVAQLRDQRDAVAKGRRERRQALDPVRRKGARVLSKRASEETPSMEKLRDFGRF